MMNLYGNLAFNQIRGSHRTVSVKICTFVAIVLISAIKEASKCMITSKTSQQECYSLLYYFTLPFMGLQNIQPYKTRYQIIFIFCHLSDFMYSSHFIFIFISATHDTLARAKFKPLKLK